MKRTLLVLSALVLGSCVGPAGFAEAPKGLVCFPLHFAGITVAISNDSQIQRLLGRGVFRADEGHSGGRYFLDTKHTATLHIVEGVDTIVDELTVRSGIDPKLKPAEHTLAVSKWFDPQEAIGDGRAVHLGASKDEVVENLGEPQKRITANQWQYESTCSCGLPAYVTLSFKSSRVTEINMAEEE